MQTIEEFLAGKPEVTIHALSSYVRQYLAEHWRPVLEEREAELQRTYAQAGEWAYGVYARALFAPLRDALRRAGFRSAPEFPGAFESSVERWGPPEERERCLWSVIQSPAGETLGTIVVRLFHDHTRFHLPHAPAALALTETDETAIATALADPATHRPPKEAAPITLYGAAADRPCPTWEYSVELGLGDCLDAGKPEISAALLDHALARWGRHGWELTAVVSHGGRVAAFFRRPGGAQGAEEGEWARRG